MDSKKLHLGEKIKLLRQKSGVLPEDLAPILNISGPILSKIESGVTSPTVATLLKLSQYFDVPMETFFSDNPLDKPLQVVRAEEHDAVDRPRPSGQVAASYRYEPLAPHLKNKHMQPFLVALDPGVEENLPALSHDGEEFLYVLEGTLDFHADKEVINLRQGDCIYFHSKIPHAVYGRGEGKSRAVVVIYSEKQKS